MLPILFGTFCPNSFWRHRPAGIPDHKAAFVTGNTWVRVIGSYILATLQKGAGIAVSNYV